MVHYFNPGHETAILNASKYYMPAANQIRMQKDLAYLPAWYASPDDYVFTQDTDTHSPILPGLAQAIAEDDLITHRNILSGQTVSLWGLSPHSIHFFEQLNKKHDLQLQIPSWTDDYRRLSGRQIARECLLSLTEDIPEIQKDILPEFYSRIEDIEDLLQQNNYLQLIKTPYSSSGRGLLWLPPGKLTTSSKQILAGMLKKQSFVSIEKALNNQLDFSMHFIVHSPGKVSFEGYSIFQTNTKGAYEGSFIAPQKQLEIKILSYIREELLIKVKYKLGNLLEEKFSSIYQGNIGVDMLIYQNDNHFFLHPCLEINMRKSMGCLVLQLQKKHIHEDAQGYFFIDYDPEAGGIYKKHLDMQQQHPSVIRNDRIESGYLTLCPVREDSHYRAYVLISRSYPDKESSSHTFSAV